MSSTALDSRNLIPNIILQVGIPVVINIGQAWIQDQVLKWKHKHPPGKHPPASKAQQQQPQASSTSATVSTANPGDAGGGGGGHIIAVEVANNLGLGTVSPAKLAEMAILMPGSQELARKAV